MGLLGQAIHGQTNAESVSLEHISADIEELGHLEGQASLESWSLFTAKLYNALKANGGKTIKTIDGLLKKANAAKGKTPSKSQVSIGQSILLLSRNKVSTSFSDIEKTYAHLESISSIMEKDHLTPLSVASAGVESAIKAMKLTDSLELVDFFNLMDTKDRVNDIFKALDKFNDDKLNKLCDDSATIGIRKAIKDATAPLSSNYVMYKDGNSELLSDDLAGRVDELLDLRYRIAIDKSGTLEYKKEPVDVLTIDQVITLLERAKAYIQEMNKVIDSGAYKKIQTSVNNCMKSPIFVGALIPVVGKIAEFSPTIRAVWQAPQILNRWSAQPYIEMTNHVSKVNNALISLCEKSIDAHK